MKSMVVRSTKELVLEERELPEPGFGQVRIRVHACGICHSDKFVTEALWPDLELPRVPGHEVAGVVDALGEGVDHFKVGDRVGLGWHGGHDGTCDVCLTGRFIHCRNQKITGISFDGGYSEYLIAPAVALATVPDGMDLAEAAPLLCAGVTTFNALRNAGARSGDRVAIQGLGGLGHLGVQYARAMGFEVVAISRGEDKEGLAREIGAIDLLSRDARVQGWSSGTATDSTDAMAFAARHGVRPMIEKHPLEDAPRALETMMKGTVRFRAVLET